MVEALLKHCWSIVEAACQFKSRQFFELKVVLRLLPDAWGPYPARYLVPLLVIPGQKAVALAVLPMRFPALWGVMVKSSGCKNVVKTCQGFSLWAASDHGNLPETCSTPRGNQDRHGLASKFQGSHGGQLGAMHYDIGLLCCMPSDQVFQWLKHIKCWYTLYLSMCTKCSRGQCQQNRRVSARIRNSFAAVSVLEHTSFAHRSLGKPTDGAQDLLSNSEPKNRAYCTTHYNTLQTP